MGLALPVFAHSPPPSNVTPFPNVTSGALTFDDEFTSLSISEGATYDGSKWYTQSVVCCGTAYGKMSSNPSPFLPLNPGLDIRWNGNYTGTMATIAPDGTGFTQKYGVFEIKAKHCGYPSCWNAFWLLPLVSAGSSNEIDVYETYGEWPTAPGGVGRNHGVWTTLHVPAGGTEVASNIYTAPVDISADYHIYDMVWTPSTMTFYFDGVQFWQTPTPAAMNVAEYVIVNLGMNGGYSIASGLTHNPSDYDVAYVRIWNWQ